LVGKSLLARTGYGEAANLSENRRMGQYKI
jgi:hypothetical protein